MADPAFTALREEVLAANLALPEHGLVTLTWGNASGVDRERGVVGIKPSGVAYAGMTAADIVIVDLAGEQVDGRRRPSTDTPTHVGLYRELGGIGGIVHTHSTWATAWAQAGREIPVLGTTHADLCDGPIPLTRPLTDVEVGRDYEGETGGVIVAALAGRDPAAVPCVLVAGHAPFCWGLSAMGAVANAVSLEEVARMALLTTLLRAECPPLLEFVRAKHFERKHGPAAYYGQGAA